MPPPGSRFCDAAGRSTRPKVYSPWLHADGGCLRKQGEFTRLTVDEPGVYRISSECLATADSAAPSSSARPCC